MSGNARVWTQLSAIPADFGPCALCIGNFDGVHAGHRELIRHVVRLARENGWRAAAMTFDPHPTRIVAPERAPQLMTTTEQRAQLMAEQGIEEILILPFDEMVANWSPDYFVRTVLVEMLKVQAVVVGRNFRFGNRHAGNTVLLASLGEELGFRTELVPSVWMRGSQVSSSIIRGVVAAGNVSRACRLLTRPYRIEGPVVQGQGIGSKQTVPTLNLAAGELLLPCRGVYVTRTTDLGTGKTWRSITNVGNRPTFGGESVTVETFLLESLTNTPREIRVEFLHWLRAEKKFDSPEALKQQILQDVRRAQTYHRRVS